MDMSFSRAGISHALKRLKGFYDKKFREGFYYLKVPSEDEPVLVHGYHCADLDGEFIFGFNTYDGGAYIPLKDLVEGTEITPVAIMATEEGKIIWDGQ